MGNKKQKALWTMSLESKRKRLEAKREKIETEISLLKEKQITEITRVLHSLDLKDLEVPLIIGRILSPLHGEESPQQQEEWRTIGQKFCRQKKESRRKKKAPAFSQAATASSDFKAPRETQLSEKKGA